MLVRPFLDTQSLLRTVAEIYLILLISSSLQFNSHGTTEFHVSFTIALQILTFFEAHCHEIVFKPFYQK